MHRRAFGSHQPSGIWAGLWTAAGWVGFALPLALYAVHVLS